MVSFKDISRRNLIKIIRAYNLTHHIPLTNKDGSKRSKDEMIKDMEKHLYIDEKDKKIKEIQQQDFIESLPPTVLQQKNIKATLTQIKKTPELKKLLKPEDLEYLEKNKPKKSKKALEKEKIQMENMKKLFEANIKPSSDAGFEKLIEKEKEARKIKAERERKGIFREERKKRTPKTKKPIEEKEDEQYKKRIAKEEVELKKSVSKVDKLMENFTKDNFEEMMAKLLGLPKPELKKLDIEGKLPDNSEIKETIKKLEEKTEKLRQLYKKKEVIEKEKPMKMKDDILKLSTLEGLVDIQGNEYEKKQLKKIGEFLMKDMKDEKYKIYVTANKKEEMTKSQKVMMELSQILKNKENNVAETWGRGTFNIFGELFKYDYDLFSFSKEDGHIVLRSVACINESRNDKYIEIKYLSGTKYTYRIFEFLKNLIEKDKGKNPEFNLNWYWVKYLKLESLPSFNTLYFYSRQDLEIDESNYYNLHDSIYSNFKMLSKNKDKYEKLKNLVYNNKVKEIMENHDWDDEFDYMPELYYFYDVKGADKIKKKIEDELGDFRDLDIMKEMKETFKDFEYDEKQKNKKKVPK